MTRVLHRMGRGTAYAAGLLALAIFATWPLLLHLDEFLFISDPMVSAWDLWWVPHAIGHLENPWFTSDLLAPDGTYLSFHALVPLAGLVMTPITLLFGAGTAYNLLGLLLPIVAALSARALAAELGLRRGSAWVAGCLYGFSTIVDWRTTFHMNFGAGMALLPLPLLFWARYSRTRRRRNAALAGAMVGAVLYADPTIAFFAALTVTAYAVVALIGHRDVRTFLWGAATAAGAGLLVGLPQLLMMVRAATNGGYKANPDALATYWIPGSSNVLTTLSPGNVRTWFPGTLEMLAYQHPRGEATPVYGWGVLALALVGVVVTIARRRSAPLPAHAIVWGVLLALMASILALGPVLRLATVDHIPMATTLHGQRLSELMPYTWLTRLPVFADVRIPARFIMLGILPLTILAGAGAQALWSRGRAGMALAGALCAVALLESGYPQDHELRRWVPLERSALTAPIANDRSDSIVVDVPLGFVSGTAGAGTSRAEEGMLRATQHGHRIAGAYLSRLGQNQIDHLVTHRFYADLIALQSPTPAGQPAPAPDPVGARADATAMNARWVVVWPEADRRVLPYLRSVGFRLVRVSGGAMLMRR